MRIQLNLSQKVLLLVAVPVCAELIFIVVLGLLLRQVEFENERSERSRAIVGSASNLTKATFDACANLIAYNLSKGSIFADSYERNINQIPMELKFLRRLVGNDQEELKSLERIEDNANRGLKLLIEAKSAADESGVPNLLQDTAKGDIQKIITSLADEVDILVAREKKLDTTQPEDESRSRSRIEYAIIGGIILNLIIAIVMTIYVNRSITNRLLQLIDNAKRFASGEPLLPPVGEADEITKLDGTFRDMAAQLTESNRLKQDFLEMVSHDVRTPLGSVSLSLQMMDKAGDEKKRGSYVAVALKNIDQVIELLNELLDIHRLESDKLELLIVETSASEILDDAIERIAPLAENRGVKIVSPADPTTIKCDADRLIQVFINLLSNALKYSPEDSEITVDIEHSPEFVVVSIRDHGPGVPDEFKTRIFDRFQQVQRSDEIKHGGRGLGLAICKAIVEKHGGTIGVSDAEGGGSKFWVRLPRS